MATAVAISTQSTKSITAHSADQWNQTTWIIIMRISERSQETCSFICHISCCSSIFRRMVHECLEVPSWIVGAGVGDKAAHRKAFQTHKALSASKLRKGLIRDEGRCKVFNHSSSWPINRTQELRSCAFLFIISAECALRTTHKRLFFFW